MRNLYYIVIILLSIVIFSFSCASRSFQKVKNGIILTIKEKDSIPAQKIKIQVVNDRVVHVQATADKNFFEGKSLITVPNLRYADKFSVSETDKEVVLSTDSLKVTVNKSTGEIAFFDKQNNPILLEKKGGGKTFTPIEVEGTKGYTLRQIFESQSDEAFYGLGQHQSDEFNYKGKNESLFQYNTKVSVPMIVSNKNYGILWDNYSLSKFGDIRDYGQLNQFKLYDKTGKEGGLTATYANKEKTITRIESSIDYENLSLIKNFPENFDLSDATVVWEGQMESPESGIYRFLLHYAGYTKVFLNNEPIVKERWRAAWNPNDYKFSYNFNAGQKIPIRIEWKPDGNISYLSLKALSPLDEAEQKKLSLWSEMGNEINYFFIYGKDMDDVISGYRTVTGKSQVMPQWAMGFWQSRERYKTQHELLETLAKFREKHIPIDNIVQDWSYWPVDAWGSHDFDKTRYPDPKGMVDSVHAMNAKIMISVWPKFYITTEHYKQFDEHGWMYRQAVKDSIRDWIYPGYIGSFYDAYAEGARKLFWKQLEQKLYPLGFDAWWMDASEPNIQDNTDMNYRKKLCGPTALGPSTKYFNAYALMNAEAIYDGQRGVDPNRRVFLLTRSGFAGLQRYSTAVWSGDIGTRWEDMKAQISAGLNFSLSGIPYWTMDIGGFSVEKRYENGQRIFDKTGMENADLKEWRELNTRWYQFGAFVPLFRAHGQFPYREPFNIAPEDHPAYKSILFYDRLRYRLMPYIYSLAGMTFFDDYTIMRALVMDFTDDENVIDIGDQYMFGTAFMACPVYEYGARTRKVYFPNCGGWYDLYSGTFIDAKQWKTVDAPYERMPIFVRAGSIVPFGPEIEYYNQKLPDEITLYVYDGQNGSFTLYEDEAVNYNYEKGKFSMIPFSFDNSTKTLTIGERKGTYDRMLQNRKFNVIFVQQNSPKPLDFETKGMEVKYAGKKVTIKL